MFFCFSINIEKNLKEFPNIKYVVTELKNYTQVNWNNTKNTEYMSNENYYNYIRNVQNRLEDIYIESGQIKGKYGR